VPHAGAKRKDRLPAAGHDAHEHELRLLRRGQERETGKVAPDRRFRVLAEAQIDGVDRP
jgi:hypothetical protein